MTATVAPFARFLLRVLGSRLLAGVLVVNTGPAATILEIAVEALSATQTATLLQSIPARKVPHSAVRVLGCSEAPPVSRVGLQRADHARDERRELRARENSGL